MLQVDQNELIDRIKQKDYAAFEEMHHLYYPELLRLAIKKIGDADEAYDLLQEMFIEIWEKSESLHIPNSLDAWLRNRTWFKLSGYFRSKGFREKHIRLFGEFLKTEQLANTDSIESKEINEQYEAVISLVQRTIDEMPDKMKTVFLMSKEGHSSVSEIAEELELSPKTVKNQLHLAMKRVRVAVADTSLTTAEILLILLLM